MTEKNCSTKGFKALMITQFLGAFNDNVFKLVLSLLVVNHIISSSSGIGHLVLLNALFVLPFILFSTYAGYLADRFSKTSIIIFTKGLEIVVMLSALYFLYTSNIPGLLVVLFFMGLQSTIFSPSKYGILPEILDSENLSKGNGRLEFWTFAAIIAGTAVGGVLQGLAGERTYIPGIVVVLIACCGFVVSFYVSKTSPAGSSKKLELNPLSVIKDLKQIAQDRALFLTVVGLCYFWFLGALFQLNILLYAKQLMGLGDIHTALLVVSMGVGIGTGSLVAGVVSEGKVELGLVPLGGLGIALFGGLLLFSYPSFVLTALAILLLGFSGGLFIVPLHAYLQEKSPKDSRGRYIAASNFATFVCMLLSSLALFVLIDFVKVSPAFVFFVTTISAIVVTIYLCRLLPNVLVRCINWIITHSLYKLKVQGREYVPAEGGALLVCNHVSYIDACLLLASIGRPIRFIMHRPIYEAKLIHPFVKAINAIPIEAGTNPKKIMEALLEAREAIQNGELVCIFAEGSLSRIGTLLPFSKGFERIMKGVDAPIIPVYLDKVWGSIFSYKDGKFFWKRPKQIPYPVSILYGSALAATSKTHAVRSAVQELSTAAFKARKHDFELLHGGFIKVAKQHPFRRCMLDSTGKKMRFGKALVSALSLSQVFAKECEDESYVGVLLPSTVAGALSNIALLLAGYVPVNLNFTASKAALDSAIKQCAINTIISSKTFVEKISFETDKRVIYIEDIISTISFKTKLINFLVALFAPVALIKRFAAKRKFSQDDIATVIFSSGSTGEPKGVMLSHRNIISNLSALYDVFQIGKKDAVMGVLPFFHSFGFTGTLWLPLLAGIKAVYHPNPMDSGQIGDLVQKNKATLLMATPTFLLGYIRKCSSEQFKTLRIVVVGAEKLKEKVSEAFTKKFGVKPLEGYGATELSPVAAINIPDHRKDGIKQIGHKLGTVGNPIPGVSVRIVDPDTFEVLAENQEGLLLINGANVMCGYLANPEKTSEVIKEGWYITGDIAKVDSEGFITITDRMSRFSKIGGEMVPHIKVEEEIHKVLDSSEPICVVTSLPDEKKGEKLVVLCTKDIDASTLVKKLADAGLPPLWIPKKDCFYKVEEFPLLGSGKLDLRAIKELAEQSSSSAKS